MTIELTKNIKAKLQGLRCIHRQDINHHPSCFSKGLIKYPDAKAFEKFSGEPWYHYPGYRIGYFDIETTGLKADFSTLLSWCIKEKDGDVISSVVTKEELFDPEQMDRRVVSEFIETISQFSILIGYFSSRFDMPYMRTKALHYGMEFPGYGELYHWDLFFTVKSKLNLSRKSLDNACNYLGIEGKTPIEKEVWRKAMYGDPESLSEVLRHNVADVEITEQLHDKLEFTRKWIKSSL